MDHLRYLASDQLKGRGNGTPELEEAARYIAGHFESHGLEPAGEGGGYFQEFPVPAGQILGPGNGITLQPGLQPGDLRPEVDYVPLASGPDVAVRGELVFAGFGITASDLDYDDYRGLDVRGKIVVAMEHEPQELVEESRFSGTALTPYASPLHKIMNAKARGAVGLMLLPDSFQHPDQPASLQPGGRIEEIGIHTVLLTSERGEGLVQAAGRDLDEIGNWINTTLLPRSFSLEREALLAVDVAMAEHRVRNVLGLIRGRLDQVIVIGAHYDHLGTESTGSLARGASGQIHNGADDNASGTAGLLDLVRQFSGTRPRRGLLFIAFAGEEMGLLGSRHYSEHPTFPLEQTMAMINLDMIGRSKGDLEVGGVGTAAGFREVLDSARETSELRLSFSDVARGSSDHVPFSRKRIPSLFFFSGLHEDYHRPSDDWERINVDTLGQVLEVVRETVEGLSGWDGPFEYTEVPRRLARGERGDRSRPLLGVLLDTSWGLGGVRFDGILPGSPADGAGLQTGDIVVRLDGEAVTGLEEFSRSLGSRRVGERVRLELLRNGMTIEVDVELSAR